MSEKAKAAQVRTTPCAVTWIRKHRTAEQLRSDGHKTPKHAALWWLAAQQADAYLDSFTRRDWAALLLEGTTPLTLKDLQDELDARFDDGAYESVAAQVEVELRTFFGVAS